MALCKRKYLRIADPEAEKRLNNLLEYCEENDLGHVSWGEKQEGNNHHVQVVVDIKMSANESERKRIMSIEKT